MANLPPALLTVTVMSGDSIVLDTKAHSISSRNEKGRFDILPMHTNFISLVKEFVTIDNETGEKQQIVIKKAIMRVYENNVQIFIGAET